MCFQFSCHFYISIIVLLFKCFEFQSFDIRQGSKRKEKKQRKEKKKTELESLLERDLCKGGKIWHISSERRGFSGRQMLIHTVTTQIGRLIIRWALPQPFIRAADALFSCHRGGFLFFFAFICDFWVPMPEILPSPGVILDSPPPLICIPRCLLLFIPDRGPPVYTYKIDQPTGRVQLTEYVVGF